MSHIVLVSAT